MDISFESLRGIILNTKIYDTGSAFLLDKDYSFIVDGKKKSTDKLDTLENGKYKFIIDELKNKKSMEIETNFEGHKQMMGYYTLNNGQIMGLKVPSSEVFKNLNKLIYIIVLIIALGIIVSIIIALVVGRRISRPIEVATSFIGKLAKGAVEQAREAQDGSYKLNILAGEIEEVVVSITNLKEYSVEMEKMQDKGSKAIKELNVKLELNVQATEKVANNIDGLSDKSSLVWEIISTIQSIASQTNLLALNEAIEAARSRN